MNKKLAIVSSFCLGIFLSSFAQENISREVDELIKAHVIQSDFLTDYNLSVIEQVGDCNSSRVIQIDEGLIPNSVKMIQEGYGHTSYVEQTGTGHITQLNQSGVENEANLWSAGKDVKMYVTQNGSGNIINSYIENHSIDTRSADLIQEGDYNIIDLALIGDGFTNNNLKQRVVINQVGNAHEIKAFMEPFSAPLEINQSSSAGGEGMKVDVSTSAFYFPMK